MMEDFERRLRDWYAGYLKRESSWVPIAIAALILYLLMR